MNANVIKVIARCLDTPDFWKSGPVSDRILVALWLLCHAALGLLAMSMIAYFGWQSIKHLNQNMNFSH